MHGGIHLCTKMEASYNPPQEIRDEVEKGAKGLRQCLAPHNTLGQSLRFSIGGSNKNSQNPDTKVANQKINGVCPKMVQA